MRKSAKQRPLMLALLTVPIAAVTGCGMSNPILSSGPEPRVEDCMMLSQATPGKFVCNGKTYTAVQLSDLRNGVAEAAK